MQSFMVEQAGSTRFGTSSPRSGAQDVPAAPAMAEAPEAVPRSRLILFVFMSALLVPGYFYVAGSSLTVYRLVLLALFPLLAWRWITGAAGKPNTVDILILCGGIWIILGLIANHGFGVLPFAGILFVEGFGGYLIGRMLVRNASDFKRYFTFYTILFAILLPFALVEMVTGKNLLRMFFDVFLSLPPRQVNLGLRLGFVRPQTVFHHPILYGLMGSMGFANVLYIYRKQFMKSLRLGAFFLFVTFTALSSGPMLSILCQCGLIFWDRTLRFLRGRWALLAICAFMGLGLLRLAEEFNIVDFVINNLTYDPTTAPGRLINFEYGMAEIQRHPFFGIGQNDWVRPWWRKPSFDNFWVGYAMRYGIPTFLFLVLAILVSFAKISSKDLSETESDYRTGYLITLIGVVITLGTVNIWEAANVFVSIYIGMGAWFYTRGGSGRPAVDPAVRERRMAQARAFGPEGNRPLAPRPEKGQAAGTAGAAAGTPSLRTRRNGL